MFKVMIHPADYDSVRPAVDRAFELFPVPIDGKKVLIKPNVLRSSKAEEGIVTHPAVLRAVVEKVEQMNAASIVVGDNPGSVSWTLRRMILAAGRPVLDYDTMEEVPQ